MDVLPVRATLEDIDAICGYLAAKPRGATLAEAKAVLDSVRLDPRKTAALKYWGLIEAEDGRFKVTELGRRAAKDKGAYRSEVLRSVIREIEPYFAVVERAAHRGEYTLTASEVGAHWHEHFSEEASDSDEYLNNQAVTFFQIASGADLGTLTIGRKGSPTRFAFDQVAIERFVAAHDAAVQELDKQLDEAPRSPVSHETLQTAPKVEKGNRVFISHGRDKKILEQVKEIVLFGKFQPVVAMEHETVSKPVPDKVLDDMRNCQAAVIHVSSEGVMTDEDGKPHTKINGNVLIEIGAAMALYRRNFVLLVEDGVQLPSNLQGLYECRYKGDTLDGAATMKLLKTFNEFK